MLDVVLAALLLAPSLQAADPSAFMEEVARRERPFYRAGVSYDAATGMTFDGHPVDFATGEPRGAPRNWSAASKESLHLILLVKSLRGDPTARLALDRAQALPVLQAKIASYERFDRRYPGFGGFLPWYAVKDGSVEPQKGWEDRVPALDNGQLAWSLYWAADGLEELGYGVLARRYRARFEAMRRNAVRVFFDRQARKLRGEAVLVRGSGVPPERNSYAARGYFIEDPYEGLLMAHFMDLFGEWASSEDREAFWSRPLRKLATWRGKAGPITVEAAWVGSSHEQWGFLVLPYRDVPLCDALFRNFQRARTISAAENGWPGLRASTHRPVRAGEEPDYEPALGVPGTGGVETSSAPVFAPYAAFPLALVDKAVFAAWLKAMLKEPGMWGPYGIGESFSPGGLRAPLLTWDGKALVLVAWMGGIADDVRALLKRDGLYGKFLERVRSDYRRLDAAALEGTRLPLSLPRLQ